MSNLLSLSSLSLWWFLVLLLSTRGWYSREGLTVCSTLVLGFSFTRDKPMFFVLFILWQLHQHRIYWDSPIALIFLGICTFIHFFQVQGSRGFEILRGRQARSHDLLRKRRSRWSSSFYGLLQRRKCTEEDEMPSHLCGFLFPSVSFSSKYSISQVSPSCAFWDADTEGTVIKRLGAKGQTPALTSSIKQRLYAGSILKNKQKQTTKLHFHPVSFLPLYHLFIPLGVTGSFCVSCHVPFYT